MLVRRARQCQLEWRPITEHAVVDQIARGCGPWSWHAKTRRVYAPADPEPYGRGSRGIRALSGIWEHPGSSRAQRPRVLWTGDCSPILRRDHRALGEAHG